MIFVTVGTHEQPFNRLIEEVDRLVLDGIITDEVIVQTGYSTYQPNHCKWYSLLTYDEMNDFMSQADLVITHGGPATFMAALSKGKRVVVVPRLKKYDEHVNDHQLEFVNAVKSNHAYPLAIVEDIGQLSDFIKQDISPNSITFSNNDQFNKKLRKEMEGLLNDI